MLSRSPKENPAENLTLLASYARGLAEDVLAVAALICCERSGILAFSATSFPVSVSRPDGDARLIFERWAILPVVEGASVLN